MQSAAGHGVWAQQDVEGVPEYEGEGEEEPGDCEAGGGVGPCFWGGGFGEGGGGRGGGGGEGGGVGAGGDHDFGVGAKEGGEIFR